MILVELKSIDPTIGCRLTWQLLRERPALANISHVETSYEQHETFFLDNPYRAWLGIQANGTWVGAIVLTVSNEIGIAILEEHRGKGYAEQALKTVLEQWLPLPAIPSIRRGTFIANIAPGNDPSKNLFEKLGAKLIQLTYEL